MYNEDLDWKPIHYLIFDSNEIDNDPVYSYHPDFHNILL